MASNSSALTRVTFQTPEKPGEESSHRKLGKLTIKYNRKDLQRWLDLEEWINAQLQELYQCRLREETEAAAPEPQIDLEDLLEVPNEEQKLKLQEILHECSSPTETARYLLTTNGYCCPIGKNMYFHPGDLESSLLERSQQLPICRKQTEETNWFPLKGLTEKDFITELLSRLKGLRRVTNLQKK